MTPGIREVCNKRHVSLSPKGHRTGRPKGTGHPGKERATRESGRTFGLSLLILPLRSRRAGIFRPKNGSRTSACSSDAVRTSCELEGEAEADVIVAIRRRVVVAISGAAVLGVVVPAAAAIHAVRALWRLTLIPQM